MGIPVAAAVGGAGVTVAGAAFDGAVDGGGGAVPLTVGIAAGLAVFAFPFGGAAAAAGSGLVVAVDPLCNGPVFSRFPLDRRCELSELLLNAYSRAAAARSSAVRASNTRPMEPRPLSLLLSLSLLPRSALLLVADAACFVVGMTEYCCDARTMAEWNSIQFNSIQFGLV